MKVLIAMDKFKGSMTASEAADVIANALPGLVEGKLEIRISSIADGGEGTAEIVVNALGGDSLTSEVENSSGHFVHASWGWIEKEQLAVVEMATASGLQLVENQREGLDPWRASTRGTGQLLVKAIERGARNILVGLGGSATNDGGSGMAQALGVRFLGSNGQEIDGIPARLGEVARMEASPRTMPEILVASDVTNPLLGEQGCSRVYGPQKGIQESEIGDHERRLEHLARMVQRDLGGNFTQTPGAGAAGGLGFGLLAFCGARLEPGFELVARLTHLEESLHWADLVFTGEGSLDAQSLNGKGPVGVARMARSHGKPVIGLAGRIPEPEIFRDEFQGLIPLIQDPADAAASMEDGASFLRTAMANSRDLLLSWSVK